MKKKIVELVLVAALALTAIGGTFAYFTDTETKTNTFTVGSVDIQLLESKFYTNIDTDKDDTAIRDSAKEYDDYLAEQGKNVVPGREFNKAIYVDNTGINDAYVRVRMIVTRDQFNSFYFYENSTALEDETIVKGIKAHYADGNTKNYSYAVNGKDTNFADIKADNNWTMLEYIYTYKDALKKSDLTDRSPVWKFRMKDNLDNEDVEGLKLDTQIMVYADAIQAEGFDTAAAAFIAFEGQTDASTDHPGQTDNTDK